jgi:hypothetical protein
MLLNASAHRLSDKWVSDLTTDILRIRTLRLEGGGDVRGPPDEVYNHVCLSANTREHHEHLTNVHEHYKHLANLHEPSQTPHKHSQTSSNTFEHLLAPLNSFEHLRRPVNYVLTCSRLHTTTLTMRHSCTALSE